MFCLSPSVCKRSNMVSGLRWILAWNQQSKINLNTGVPHKTPEHCRGLDLLKPVDPRRTCHLLKPTWCQGARICSWSFFPCFYVCNIVGHFTQATGTQDKLEAILNLLYHHVCIGMRRRREGWTCWAFQALIQCFKLRTKKATEGG